MKTTCALLVAAVVAGGCSSTKPLDGAVINPRIANAVDHGPVAPGTEFEFVIGTRLRSVDAVNKYITNRKLSGDSMSPYDFGEQFAPSAADYAKLLTWLRASGFTVVRTTQGRTSVTVRGTAETIARALQSELHGYSDFAGAFQALSAPPQLPVGFGNVILGFVGLNGGDSWAPHLRIPDPNAVPPPAGPATPTTLHTMYSSANVMNAGMGETVAILGTGNAPSPTTDVAKYMSTQMPYGVTTLANGQYTQVFVGGPNRDDAQTAQNEYLENCLDIDMVLAMAPYAKVVHVFTATNGGGLFTDGISYIVDQVPQAHAVSVSYGTCERGAAGEMPVMNALFMQAQAEGQQWFFAAGDSGTDGCRDGSGNKILSAGWPASSPYVVGVGGTEVSGTTEVVWNDNQTGNGAGGGGVSESLDKPAYQTGVTPNDASRDEPDVSALAGSPGLAIVVNGAASSVGGTSAATPIWAGVWALIDQKKGGGGIKDGLTHMYSLAAAAATKTIFNDITATATFNNNGGPGDQSTGGYAVGPNYDLATGWGTPNVANLLADW